MIRLFPGEQVLGRFAGDEVILTTHRICYGRHDQGYDHARYVLLVNIRTCSPGYRRNIISLLFSMCLAVSGLYLGLHNMLWPSVITLAASAVFAAVHFSNSRNMIIVRAVAETIEIRANGMNLTGVLDCISHIEQARNNRAEHLKNKNLVVYCKV